MTEPGTPTRPTNRINDAAVVARHARAWRRAGGLAFALGSHAAGLLAMLAFYDFLAGTLLLPFGGVDHGAVTPVRGALVIDLALVALFGLTHSVMARDAFKARWTRLVPPHLERSAYVLVAALALAALVALWRPLPGTLWSAPHEGLALVLDLAFLAGAALTVASTFQFSHAELFGLAAPLAAWRGGAMPEMGFRVPYLYRFVRHPMQLGLLVSLWSVPVLTVGRALLAAALTAYVLVGLRLEERALLRRFGERYASYRRRVPMLVPHPSPRRLLALGALLLVANVVSAEGASRARAVRETFEHAGIARTHRTVLPPVRGANPVLIVLHGRGQDGALMRRLVGPEVEPFAAAHGWIVAYPDGVERSWNDCRASLGFPAHRAAVPDTWFLRAMVRRLAFTHDADTSRVLVLGYSNGGHLAHRLAADAPAMVRGVAVFGANLPALERERCFGRAPTLFIAGTDDKVSPVAGGAMALPTGAAGPVVLSAAASAEVAGDHDALIPPLVIDGLGHEMPAGRGRAPRLVASARAPVLRQALDFLASTIR